MRYQKSVKHVLCLAKLILVLLLAITVSVTAVDRPIEWNRPAGEDEQILLETIEDVSGAATFDKIDRLDSELLASAPSNFKTNLEDEDQAVSIDTDKSVESLIFKKDTSIKDALRFLAAKYHRNIIPSAKVDGVLTVTTLYNVTFEEALEVILGHNFKYEQKGNFIRVYTADEYAKFKQDPTRMTYRVFTLYYITAAEAIKLITPILSSAGQIQGSTAADAGISTGGTGVGTGAGGDSMALNDCVIVYDYPENIVEIEQLIKSVDIRPQQVLVEATILSATLTEENQLGIDLNLLGGVSLTGTSSTSDLTTSTEIDRGSSGTSRMEQVHSLTNGTPLEVSGFAAVGGSGLRVGVRTGDLVAFITALESVTDITIMANPKILALNKQVGTVFIGTKIGYKSQTTQTDTSTTQKVEFLDTGTKLSFRPYIANDGYIRMDIYPKDSSGELDDQGIPTETTAELTTNIMVKDGQTIVIGGLFRDAVTTTRSQIPLLGDLPLIGAAFRGTSDTNKRQEIIVMLTPHIINNSEDTQSEARIADVSRKRHGARSTLQGIGRARIAEDHYVKAAKNYTNGKISAAIHEVDSALYLRPTYLEALRLKDRIIQRVAPDDVEKMERIMLDVIEEEETRNWFRR